MKEQKTVSIKAKLLGVIIPVVIVIVAVLVVAAYQVSARIIEEYSKNLLESSVENQKSRIEAWLNENLASFQTAKTMIERQKPDDEKMQEMLDGYYGYNENYPEGFYIADTAGKLMTASQSKKQETNVTSAVWYQEGLTRVNMAVGSAYQNEKGEHVISASGILDDDSKQVRVISVDMTLDRIAIIVNSFIEMNDAQALMVDKNSGVILANRDSDLISQTIGAAGQSTFYQLAAEKIAAKEYDFVTLDGNMTVFKEISDTNWILISFIPTEVVLADLTQLRTVMLVISLVCILLLCILIERMTHVVIRPVKRMTRVITAMAEGDFTVSMKAKGNDEIAVMGRSVETFLHAMKSMIEDMNHISAKLKGQADASKQVSGEMNMAAGIQSQSMGELNSTVDQLSASVNEIAQNATQLAGFAADTKADSSTVESRMRETVVVSEKGREDMQRVGAALTDIEVSIRDLEEAVNKVGLASGEIVQIVQLIGDIADETNLLSLNASIEAARAGEAGRGFAVVAEQIGTLAKNSADSVSHIAQLIAQINQLVEEAVRQAKNSAQDISGSAELIHTAVDTFDTIFKNIKETNRLLDGVVDKINQVDQVAANVAAISEQQAASSDEILATSESMLEQAKNISKNSEQVEMEAEHLATSADMLANQVKQFRV